MEKCHADETDHGGHTVIQPAARVPATPNGTLPTWVLLNLLAVATALAAAQIVSLRSIDPNAADLAI